MVGMMSWPKEVCSFISSWFSMYSIHFLSFWLHVCVSVYIYRYSICTYLFIYSVKYINHVCFNSVAQDRMHYLRLRILETINKTVSSSAAPWTAYRDTEWTLQCLIHFSCHHPKYLEQPSAALCSTVWSVEVEDKLVRAQLKPAHWEREMSPVGCGGSAEVSGKKESTRTI